MYAQSAIEVKCRLMFGIHVPLPRRSDIPSYGAAVRKGFLTKDEFRYDPAPIVSVCTYGQRNPCAVARRQAPGFEEDPITAIRRRALSVPAGRDGLPADVLPAQPQPFPHVRLCLALTACFR